MLKKKVVIKNKGPPDPRPQPRKSKARPTAAMTETKASTSASTASTSATASASASAATRVYNLCGQNQLPKKSTYIVNNMVKLTITLSDVERLEKQLCNKGLLSNIERPNVPVAWNSSEVETGELLEPLPKETTSIKKNPFKSLIKKPTGLTATKQTSESEQVNRKDLIINSGIKRSSQPIMQIYAHGWPAYSSYACWHCCHNFNTTPVGIPQLLVNMEFHCYGNFCSYNCAKRFLRPNAEDLQMSESTSTMCDDMGEQMQLLELLCHIETGSPIDQPIKPAPPRFALTMFGGTKTIEEFREDAQSNISYHIFRSPLVPISYQMEESIDKLERKRRQRVSLDTMKIERAFSELAEKSKRSGLVKKLRT